MVGFYNWSDRCFASTPILVEHYSVGMMRFLHLLGIVLSVLAEVDSHDKLAKNDCKENNRILCLMDEMRRRKLGGTAQKSGVLLLR